MKKQVLISAVLIGFFAGQAHAGDVPAPATYDWSGIYGGLYGGMDWDNGTAPDLYDLLVNKSPNYYRATYSGSGFTGGAILGANKQFDGGFVVGVEADLGTGGQASGIFGNGAGGIDVGATFQLNNNLTGSGRVRLGFGLDRFMPFVTGGVAYSSNAITALNHDCPPKGPCTAYYPYTGTANLIGWTAGAGVDYALSSNIILGGEYRYTDFGSNDISLYSGAVNQTRISRVGLQQSEVRATLTVKF